MKYPNLNEEKRLWKQGVEWVIGLDEAGRGPLAGPVMAAAVSLVKPVPLKGIRDSKTLSEKQREYFYEKLTNHEHIRWAVSAISEQEIDKINILNATKLAMTKAILDLSAKLNGRPKTQNSMFLLIDGNFKIDASRLRQGSGRRHDEAGLWPGEVGEPKQHSIVKGDSRVFLLRQQGLLLKLRATGLCGKCTSNTPNTALTGTRAMAPASTLKIFRNLGLARFIAKAFFPFPSC